MISASLQNLSGLRPRPRVLLCFRGSFSVHQRNPSSGPHQAHLVTWSILKCTRYQVNEDDLVNNLRTRKNDAVAYEDGLSGPKICVSCVA